MSSSALNILNPNNPEYDLLFPPCPHESCPGRLKVWLCRGTHRPENKGRYYEACDMRPGDGGHWLGWRDDLGRAQADLSQSGGSDYPTRSSTPPSLSQPSPSPAVTSSTSEPGPSSSAPLPPALLPVFTDGKCHGKFCSARIDPPRACRTCNHGLCKKDCIELQKTQPGLTCLEKRHREEVSVLNPTPGTVLDSSRVVAAAASTTVTLDGSDRSAFYDHTKPLRQEHYDAQREAFDKYQTRVQAVEERKRQEEQLQKQILILFWKQNGSPAKPFRVPCPHYPHFALSHCSPAVRAAMGTTENIVLELYDVGLKDWVGYETDTLVSVSNVETFLYRSDGVSDCPGMSDEEEKLLNAGKPRKRPAELPASSVINRVVRPRLQSEKQNLSLPTSLPSESLKSRSSPATPDSSLSIPTNIYSAPTKSSTPLPSKAPATPQIRPLVVEDSSDSDSDSSSELNLNPVPLSSSNAIPEPATLKSRWPFKYVHAMAIGFDTMDTMSGTIPQRFTAAFYGLDWKRTCWNKHIKVWKAATEDERIAAIEAGCSKPGEWRTFARSVGSRISEDAEMAIKRLDAAEIKSEPSDVEILDDNSNPTCAHCSDTLPSSPSVTLSKLKIRVDDVLKRRHARRNAPKSWQIVSALADYCRRHTTELAYENLPINTKWPAQVDFSNLAQRVEALQPILVLLRAAPQDNYFYIAALLQVGQDGMENAFSKMGDWKAAKVATVGYFGEQGAVIMFGKLTTMFPQADHYPLTAINFVRRVLLPETAVLLTQEDLGCSRQEAINVLRDSREYGLVMHPDNEGLGEVTECRKSNLKAIVDNEVIIIDD